MIYIAHPYSCLQGKDRQDCLELVAKLALEMMKENKHPMCPVLMGMNILEFGHADSANESHHQHQMWEALDEHLISLSENVWFFSTSGAKSSEGMCAEATFVLENNIEYSMVEHKSDGGFFVTQGAEASDFVEGLAALDTRVLRKEKSSIVYGQDNVLINNEPN